MFRNFYSDGRLSEGQAAPPSPPPASPLGVASVAFDGQESSWIGLLSRPALSLLRKFRLRSAAPADIRNSFIGEESEILRQLNEMMPPAAQHLGFTRCQQPDGAAGIGGSVAWLAPGEMELHPDSQFGYFSSVRTLINQVLVSSQEVQAAEAKAWASVGPPAGNAAPWWGSFLREEEAAAAETDGFCPPPAAQTESKNPGATELVHSGEQNTEGPAGNQDQVPEEPEPAGPAPLQCQNKNIAFIMGCPCSDDDDSSESEPESHDSDDDDGFDSEGSSDLSESSDEEEDEDSESERLWNSLCQSVDPYNPQNFTARLHTARGSTSAPPRTASTSPPPVSAPLSASPPSATDSWDDSTSASEADEAESLRLLGSFSSSSDPYSPLNFTAPLRTRGPARQPPKTRDGTADRTVHQNPASPPEYRKEEAEERLDSGFAEGPVSGSAQSCRASKKVRFCDDVEEFFASCSEEEDRRGPWEELARDRCRFRRRCEEVEQNIGFCLQPQHRRRVLQRLSALPRS